MTEEERKKTNLPLIIGFFVVLIIFIIIIVWALNRATNEQTDTNIIQTIQAVVVDNPKNVKAKQATSSVKAFGAVKKFASLNIQSTPYTPQQVLGAYTSTLPSNGAGKTIAIVVAYNYTGLQQDLNTFCSLAKIPQKQLVIHYVDKITPYDDGWAIEANLDSQYATLLAPNANIHVIFSASDSTTDLRNALILANTLKPDIISMSWGIDETVVAEYSLQHIFEDQFTNPSTFYLAASGDGLVVSYPSSSNSVLSVGGTTLNMNGTKRNGEYPWADPDASGSGEGLSILFPKPAYQNNTNSSTQRMTPDVSLIANTPSENGVMVVHKGEIYGVGGTSLATPLFAGIVASSLGYRTSSTQLSQQKLLTSLYSSIQPNLASVPLLGIGAINQSIIPYIKGI